MTEYAYQVDSARTVSADTIIREMNDTKSFIMIPAPLFKLLENKQLSGNAFALYFFLYARASLNKDYVARLKMKDILNFTHKAASTVRAYMVELESHGLIDRLYISLGQKTVLTGCRLTFLSADAEILIRKTNNRKGREVAVIENKTHSKLSTEERKICTPPTNQRCTPLISQRLNNNSSSVLIKQNTAHQPNPPRSNDPTSDFVFSIFTLNEGNYALAKLTALSYTGKRGMELLEQMAFSFQKGNWSDDRKKTINAMLKLIRLNQWRSPY